jgi:hypothetical protein
MNTALKSLALEVDFSCGLAVERLKAKQLGKVQTVVVP